MSLCLTCFFLPHGTCLVMLNTCNYVVLGWNTASTSFFTTLKTILLGLLLGPVDKNRGRYCTETCVGKDYYT